jgi:CheY-like chemotaxis protein
MAYLFKQKFTLADLGLAAPASSRLVLLAEPEAALRSIYLRHLADHGLAVSCCHEVERLLPHVTGHRPHLLILSLGLFPCLPDAAEFLDGIRRRFTAMPVVTVGFDIGGEGLRQLMQAGISSHLDRRFSRPADLAAIAKTILNL